VTPAGQETDPALLQLRLLVQAQTDYAVFLLDPDGIVLTWNTGATRIKGYSEEEAVGRHFSHFYPPEAVEAGVPAAHLEIARREGRHEDEGWRVRKDGARFWANALLTALHDEHGTLLGFGKVTRDLTSRRLAEERLRTSAHDLQAANADLEQFRLLVASVRDYAIFMLDAGGYIRTWNEGARRIKGYEESEVVGRHFSIFYTDADIARDHPADELEIAAREGRFEEEGWRVRKDGSRFWSNVVITALRNAHGTLVGYAKVTRDLTERRESEQRQLLTAHKLEVANVALEEAERRAREDADRQRRRTAALELIGRAIVARSELDDIVQTAIDAATEITGARFGAFFYDAEDAGGGVTVLHRLSGAAPEAFAEFAPVLMGDPIIRSDDVTRDPRHTGLAAGAPVRSFLSVPVVTLDGALAGGLAFGSPEAGAFDAEDEAAAVSIAATAAVALTNARLLADARREAAARQVALEERDHVARVLQESLLPPALPSIPGLELGAVYQAGSELVGGDFYDVVSLRDDQWGIVLGDVCGSGPEAASRTALTRHSVRTAAMFDSDPAHVLEALNTALMRSGGPFSTAVFALVEPEPEPGHPGIKICLASGGHPPALVCRADRTVAECWSRGPLLGVLETIALDVTELRLDPGDLLVLYTDGLVEARRAGELFGPERLGQAVADLADRSPGEIAEGVVAASRAFAGGRVSDDIAVVVLRVPRS
jgi:PAS domain S-box-containing protein